MIFLEIKSTHGLCEGAPEGEAQKIYTEGSDADLLATCFYIS